MKNWFKFFFLSFFSNKISKDGTKRGFTNLFLSLILTLVFLCVGIVWADFLPFGSHYDNSTGFKTTVRDALTNENPTKRVSILVENGEVKAKTDGDYADALVINTFKNQENYDDYAQNGYHFVVDIRSADTLAEVEAYCQSTDASGTTISYEDYLSLNEIARLNFEFKLRYTGNQLLLDDSTVSEYRAFIDGTSEQNKQLTKELYEQFESGDISKAEYNREIYELYFTNYYPSITAYESSSKVPLLRNYYYHELINKGEDKFLMIFGDCMIGSFETDGGISVFFYGFYKDLENGELVASDFNAVDDFIIDSYGATKDLNTYIYIMNIIRLVPVIALMVIVVAMLTSSVLSLKGVEECRTFGAAIKIVGSYAWVSAVVTAIVTLITAFMVEKSVITVVALISFFVTTLVRSIIFVIGQIKQRKVELQALAKENAEQDINTEE